MSLEGFVHFFSFGIVGWCVGRNVAYFYPQLSKIRFLQPDCLLRIVTQLVEMLACPLLCSGKTDEWQYSRSFYEGPAKLHENNGAKMTSRSRKKFPVRISETKRVIITLPRFSILTVADLSQKDNFEELFNFQGPVISECTIVWTPIRLIKLLVTEWDAFQELVLNKEQANYS